MLWCLCFIPYHLQGGLSWVMIRTVAHEQTLLPQVCVTFASIVHSPLPSDSILLSQDFWLVIVMIFIVPLSFLKTLDALRFTSQIALGTVV